MILGLNLGIVWFDVSIWLSLPHKLCWSGPCYFQIEVCSTPVWWNATLLNKWNKLGEPASMGDHALKSGRDQGKGQGQTAVYKGKIVASDPKTFPRNAWKLIVHSRHDTGPVGQAAIFLLKVATLETIRRVSRSKCPQVWNGLQALQLLCYPPFKWIERWAPFKGLVKGVQVVSCFLLIFCYRNIITLLLVYQLFHTFTSYLLSSQ